MFNMALVASGRQRSGRFEADWMLTHRGVGV